MPFAADIAAAMERPLKYAAAHEKDEPLLRAIHAASPHDRLPSLVFADHLDETGRPAHAEVIRNRAAEYEETENRGFRPGRFVNKWKTWHPRGVERSRGPLRAAVDVQPSQLAKVPLQLWWTLPHPSPEGADALAHTLWLPKGQVRAFVRRLADEGADTADAEAEFASNPDEYPDAERPTQYKADATDAAAETRSEYVARKRQERLDSLPPHLRSVMIAKEKRLLAARKQKSIAKRRSLSPAEIAAKIREFVARRGASRSGRVVTHLQITSDLLHQAVGSDGSGLKIVERTGKADGGGRRAKVVTTADDMTLQPSPPKRDEATAKAIQSQQRDEWNRRMRLDPAYRAAEAAATAKRKRLKYAAERPMLYPQFAHPLLSHSDAAAAMTQAYRRLPAGHPLRHTLTRLHNHGEMKAAVAVQEAARRGDLEADRDYQPALATVADDLYDRLSSEGPAIEQRVKRSRPLADWDYYKQLNDYYGDGGETDTPKPRREDGGDEQPVAFAAYRAPKGGVVVRGLYYGGGSLVPDLQKFAAADADAQPTKRQRLLATLKRRLKPTRFQRERPRRYSHEAFHKAIRSGDRYDRLPSLVYADWLEENGHPGYAEVVRRHQERAEEKKHEAAYDGGTDPDRYRDEPMGEPTVRDWPVTNGLSHAVTVGINRPHEKYPDSITMRTYHAAVESPEEAHRLASQLEADGVHGADLARRNIERRYPHLVGGAVGGGAG